MAHIEISEGGAPPPPLEVPLPGGAVGSYIRAVDALVRFAGYLSMVIILAMVGLICTELALVNLFHRSLMFLDDVVGQMVAVFAFLAIGFCLREGALIRVEVIHARLSGVARMTMEIFYTLVSLVYAGVLGYYVLKLMLSSLANGTRSVSILEAPMWIPQAALPLGAAILILALIADLFGQVHAFRVLRAKRRLGS